MDGKVAGDGAAGNSGAPGTQSPQNETPEFITNSFGSLVSILESYGWFILICLCGLMYLYQKYKPSYEKWKQEQDDLREAEERKKDPDRSYNMQLNMEEARRRMQERASADAEIKRQKDLEIAERKRQEKIEEWEKHKQGKGYHSKSKLKQEETVEPSTKTLKAKKTFRPEYNPLGGDGGGSSHYRPSGRGGFSGGG